MVVGFSPGGGTDTVARIIAKDLGERLGQQVIVENKAGAGGNIATDYVAHAEPDGYTILLGSVGSLTVAPVSMAVVFPNVIIVNAAFPTKTLADFVNLSKAKPSQEPSLMDPPASAVQGIFLVSC